MLSADDALTSELALLAVMDGVDESRDVADTV